MGKRETAFLLALLSAAGSTGAASASDSAKKDLYPNYAQLSAHEHEGKDYRIELVDRANPVTALALAHRSDRCVSMHGFALADGRAVACVGGGNPRLAKAVYEELRSRAPSLVLEYPCERFGGDDAENIVNRCAHPGVQIEMSPLLREKLGSDPALAAQFRAAVRAGMAGK